MAKNYFKFPYLENSFDLVSLDLENSKPLGGPINNPSSGYSHKYTPTNKYLDSEAGSIMSNNSKLQDSFKVTGLDIENPNAGTKQGGTGGPNRTNSSNIPSGQYVNIGTSNRFGFSLNLNGVTLKNKSKNPVITKLQQYTPNKTYTDVLRLTPNDEL